MITETGKNILGRYLVGTAPAYASYIAVGCGAQPVESGTVFSQPDLDAMEAKRSLDFEMFRVPITSRGFVEENGQTEVVFSAEVPTTERYEITEIGIFSAASNPAVVGYDSRTLYAFTREESWKYNEELLNTEDRPLDNDDISNDIYSEYLAPVIQTNATNKIFKNARIERSEQSRYLNNMIMTASNFSDLSGVTSSGWSLTGKNSISLATSIDLSKNSPQDEIKLALSVVHVDGDSASIPPNRVRAVVEFTTENGNDSFRIDFENNPAEAGESFAQTRYMVLTRRIATGTATSNFLWSNVNNVNVYGAVVDSSGDLYEDGSQNPLYYLAFDAIRIENVTSNPLYGLTGYTVIQNSDPSNTYAKPIVKLPNSAAMVEFRLGIGVV